MKRTIYKIEEPAEEGRYLIYVIKQRAHVISAFTYIAHYDAENGRWLQYDLFEEVIENPIQDKITAWSETIVFHG